MFTGITRPQKAEERVDWRKWDKSLLYSGRSHSAAADEGDAICNHIIYSYAEAGTCARRFKKEENEVFCLESSSVAARLSFAIHP